MDCYGFAYIFYVHLDSLIDDGYTKYNLMFNFRWKKPKDWKNSLKIMMMTEMTQNTTGDILNANLKELDIHRFFLYYYLCLFLCVC